MNFNPLTPKAFCQKCILLDILEIFNLDVGQKKAFLTSQHGFLSTKHRVLWHFCSGMRRNQKPKFPDFWPNGKHP